MVGDCLIICLVVYDWYFMLWSLWWILCVCSLWWILCVLVSVMVNVCSVYSLSCILCVLFSVMDPLCSILCHAQYVFFSLWLALCNIVLFAVSTLCLSVYPSFMIYNTKYNIRHTHTTYHNTKLYSTRHHDIKQHKIYYAIHVNTIKTWQHYRKYDNTMQLMILL